LYVAEQNVKALEHLPYSPDLSRLNFFLFPRLRSGIEGQRFAIAQDIIARASTAVTGIENDFQECFQTFYEFVIVQGNCLEAVV
jgi:hypothetical protein